MSSPMHPIQRSLVISVGDLAAAAASRLKEMTMPQAAVGIVTIPPDDFARDQTAVIEAVRHISQTAALTRLAAAGYQLDRLHEIAVTFLVDAAEDTAEKVIDFAAQTAFSVQKQLGIHAAMLLLILVEAPEAEPVQTLLHTLATRQTPFDRGIWTVGTVNEDGLQLADGSALVAQAVTFVQSLIMTPLRDAPEWLNGHHPAAGLVCSMGTACWQWHPELEVKQLARRWALAAVDQWLAPVADENGPLSPAGQNWMLDAGVMPDALAEKVDRLLSPWSINDWARPQPWRLKAKCRHLMRMVDSITNTMPETVPLLLEEIAPQIEAMGEQLTAVCQQQMNDMPVAAVSRSRRALQQIVVQIDGFANRILDQQMQQNETSDALAAQQAAVQQQMTAQLASWPAASWPPWLAVVLRPWTWPQLAWRYVRLQQLAQRMVLQLQQQAEAERHGVRLAVMEAVYELLQQLVQRLAGQVEEVGEMLTHVRQKMSDADTAPGHLLPHYARFVESPALEAQQAATAVGGLGQQIMQLDDAVLDDLQTAGEARMRFVYQLSAIEVLSLKMKTTEARANWWRQQWLQAAPLWQFDETRLSDHQRGVQREMTIAAARQADLLAGWQGGAQKTCRFIEMTDKTKLLILRLRSGVPV